MTYLYLSLVTIGVGIAGYALGLHIYLQCRDES